MKRLTVRYFALFRETTGHEQEQLESTAVTVADLFDELRSRHSGLQAFEHMKFAINDELVPRSAPLSDGDVVLLFPPVAGG